MLTFDDGYKDHYKYVMPALVKKKISGCFFPSAENIIKNNVTETSKIHNNFEFPKAAEILPLIVSQMQTMKNME